jgi:hypothetical protein
VPPFLCLDSFRGAVLLAFGAVLVLREISVRRSLGSWGGGAGGAKGAPSQLAGPTFCALCKHIEERVYSTWTVVL